MPSDRPPLPPKAWIPNLVTAANIAVGFTSMLVAAEGRFDLAVYLLLACLFLDMGDGRLARGLKATSELGQQLDSFCDLISFGAAPAFLLYRSMLAELGLLGGAAAVLYLLAGLYRLARFNLSSDPHAKASRTTGVPIPIGAGYLMVTVLMRDQLEPSWAAAVALAMAVGMVSRWRLPDLKGNGLVSALLLIGLVNYLAVMIRPGWPTVSWWNVWNLLILLAAWREDQRLANGTPQTQP